MGWHTLRGVRLPFGVTKLFRAQALLRALPTLGFVLSISPAAAARSRSAVPPSRSLFAPAPPWSRLGGSPPPLPLDRAQGPLAPWMSGSHAGSAPALGRNHPALHGSARDALEAIRTGGPYVSNRTGSNHRPVQRLFPRAGLRSQAPRGGHTSAPGGPDGRPGRGWFPGSGSDGRKSAGSGKEPELAGNGLVFPSSSTHHQQRPQIRTSRGGACGCHIVVVGDTLWSIASRRLGTDDPQQIAAYWPHIYRLNRDVIGPDPNLVRPGQVLELPDE